MMMKQKHLLLLRRKMERATTVFCFFMAVIQRSCKPLGPLSSDQQTLARKDNSRLREVGITTGMRRPLSKKAADDAHRSCSSRIHFGSMSFELPTLVVQTEAMRETTIY